MEDEIGPVLDVQLRDIVTKARAVHKFTNRTGLAEKAIQDKRKNLVGKVFLNTGSPHGKIAVYQHEGTKDHWVAPKVKKKLYWVKDGKGVFSKGHMVRGIKQDQYVFLAGRSMADEVHTAISAAVSKAMRIALGV
jgi:hypothetical protein